MIEYLAEIVVACARLLVDHAWFVWLLGLGLGWAAWIVSRESGRWRWLAAAGTGWLVLGFVSFWSPWDRWEAQIVLLVGLLTMIALSTVAILRACGFLSAVYPLAARAGVLLVLGLLLSMVSLASWVMARESLFPWTDWAAPHAVLFALNESDRDLELTWSSADAPEWLSRGPLPAHGHGVAQILMIPSKFLHGPMPAEGFDPPPGYAKQIVLRVGTEDEVMAERLLRLRLDGHLRVHVTADNRVFIATGEQAWTGAPLYGDEVEAFPP